MKITIIDREDGDEDEIILRCRQVDEQLLKLIYALKAGMEKMTVMREGSILQVFPKDIYYFEAVDNK
ncbi:MAG: LytTR family transcriptional regulator, partial [Lachnospiraceae bacterium]|nr:LytTR family transcriptional regulator [Lachnospiraceae bacterium]